MQLKHKDFTGALVKDDSLGERQIRVVVSTPVPDRVKDVMEPRGCDIENYKSNPIVLADHNPKTPIGTAAIEVKDSRVEAVVTFAPAGISQKADEYCGLAKSGILNTVSPGFRELDVSPMKGGGMHIKAWELLELSLVSVPANPDAVVIGRSLKADANWKVGASRNLPIGEGDDWDGAAAKESVFEKAGFDGDDPDTGFARKAFLVYDAANPEDKGSYKLPFAKVVDGRLVAMPGGLRNAASRLPQTDIPDDVAEKARAVLDHYEAKMKDKEDGKSATSIKTKTFDFKRKDLYDCGNLSYAVQCLVSLALNADYEREFEGDDSNLPEILASIARQAGEALVAMVGEEVGELIARLGSLTDEQKTFIASGSNVSIKALRLADVGAKIKAGRKFSSATAKALTDHAASLDEHAKGLKAQSATIKAMLEDNTADTADDETAETDTGKALPLSVREREIEMLGLKSV